jgi:hypothetical protein
MQEIRYRYRVSLTITHPTMPVEEIINALPMAPDHSGSHGSDRFTRRGRPLPGRNERSFWHRSLHVPNGDGLERFLTSTAEQLESHARFFSDLAAGGGSARMFIGVFLERDNIVIELSPELQRRYAQLGVALGFDIYGPDRPAGAD